MSQTGKIITVSIFFFLSAVMFYAAYAGVGATNIKDTSTINRIKSTCPDGYQQNDKECLRRTVRGIWFTRISTGGGSSGGGGK